jgi:hypothetical protein
VYNFVVETGLRPVSTYLNSMIEKYRDVYRITE